MGALFSVPWTKFVMRTDIELHTINDVRGGGQKYWIINIDVWCIGKLQSSFSISLSNIACVIQGFVQIKLPYFVREDQNTSQKIDAKTFLNSCAQVCITLRLQNITRHLV